VRALYFADLTSLLTVQKQWITGLSFFFSSGAVATLVAKGPAWIPIVLSSLVAMITPWAIAVNLDASELAETDAPYDPVRIARWQDHVFLQYHLVSA